ncbi:uncharacterized protein [Nicotiana tomentosiformis]|uniref:uncharacterized protein n=1 Tax=Nicotiana tomentosiformis TaxID=4098 RepID=UPI00388C5B43
MEEMENENKTLKDQMKELQERVDKIPGAPKLLPKRNAGRFVEQPYNKEATPHAIPKTFKMPQYLRIYDGTTDPEDHVAHYVTAVKGNDLNKEHVYSILLKKFGETLTGWALTWYSQLPAHSIETFEEMADKFVTAHAGAKKAETKVNDIFTIKQSLGERLRDFLALYNKVRMTLPNVSEGMAVAAFQNGLSREGSRATRKLLSRLMKYPPITWDKIHNAYCVEVRADDDDLNGPTQRLISVQAEPRRECRDNIRRNHPISRPNRERHQPYVRALVPHSSRYDEGPSRPRTGLTGMREVYPLLYAHNFCVSPTEIVYALEKLGMKVKWPQKMRFDPSTRKSDALCEFYQERGHKTKYCIALSQEVVNMLQQGHLKELLSDKGRNTFDRGRECQGPPKPPSSARTINMIIGGNDVASINGIKFTATHKLKRSITQERYDRLKESIIFEESDADGLTFPHNDALVITLRISDTDVKCIMVDDGSEACIIHPRVVTPHIFVHESTP